MHARTFALPLLAVAFALCAPALAAAEPLVVVVDRDNPKTDISLEELKSYFTGKRGEWPDGARVVPIDLESGSAARGAFESQALGMSPAQYDQYWVDQKVRGQGSPPRSVSDTTALKMVAKIRGAIAYVPASQVDGSVRVLTVGGHAAGSPSYPLK